MSEKEYIVSLNKGVDYAAFNQEMIVATGAGDIPGRSVDIANHRHASQRNTHYMLTDSEAESLKNDGRVYGVTLKDDPSISIGVNAVQTGDFTKTTLDRGNFLNWGMRRMNESTNPYNGVSVTGGYNYTLDGTDVDVVIQDTGIQKDHPEWQDASGVSRFTEIDWYTESGISGTQNANHYRDYHGHGTHVAGTIAGKTYGWAKNAKIYALKVSGLEGSGDSGTGIAVSDCFDVIKLWHRNKPVDPAIGVKRPTIVNMSWGYGTTFTNITGGNYRGTPWTDTVRQTDKGMIGRPGDFRHVVRVASVDTDIEEMIDEGIHIVVAAGNTYQKIDVEGGVDYDNYYTKTGVGTVYYHRGGSPYSTEANIVGNVDSTAHVGGLEQKAASSETGPGVSVYAPGTDIMSAMSTTNIFGATTINNPYPANSNFLINNISGTSMAAPQVSGVLALWLQLNPAATPAQGLTFINATAKTAQLYQTGLTNDYTDARSLLGGTNRFAFNKFNSNVQMRLGAPVAAAPAAPATYALSSSVASVNEGSSFTITLTTTNVANETTVPYTITGISSADIGGASLTGNFTVNNNTATATFNVTADATTEGAETFVLTLDALSTTQSVTINDTSTTPVGTPTYAVAPAANNVNEGSALVFNVTTTNVSDATTLYWSVTNAGDFGTSTGSFTITSNAGTFSVTPTADATTEGAETFTASVRTGSVSGTIVATSSTVTINDTSTPGGGSESYALAASSESITEGENTTFTLTTTNVADATNVPYTITGVSSSDLDNGPRRKTAVKDFEGPGSAFFKREMQVGGVRLVIAGGVGGQTAVPDLFADKVARMFELFTDSAGAGISEGAQNQMIQTLIGATTSYHPNAPTIQRIARGAGGDYTPNFLTDAGIAAWGLSPLFDSTVNNDMVWYLNSSGTPGTGDEDAQEVIEHVFHTLHMHGLDAASLKLYPAISADWATGPLYNAMVEAYDASMWDPSGYQSPADAFKTDGDAFEVAAKEYLYLLNFCMFDYSTLWDGNSLAPEWNDAMRTPAGIQSNNPLGYALHNSYIATVISKPSLTTIRSIFQDGDTGNPGDAGSSGYVADAAIPLTGNFTVSSDSATLTLNVAKDGVVDVDSLTVALDNGEATQAVTVADDGVVPGFAPDYALYVTNPGGNEYTLSGYDRNGLVSGAQPTLAYNNGDKVIVTVQGSTSSAHPFYIKTAQVTGTGSQASGVDGQGTVKLEWTIGSTGTFYYQCSIHSGMNNTITVS
jgi:subtilisin family serine protease